MHRECSRRNDRPMSPSRIFGFRLFHMHSPYLRLFIERIGTALRLAYDCWVSEQPDSGRDVGVRGAGAAPPKSLLRLAPHHS